MFENFLIFFKNFLKDRLQLVPPNFGSRTAFGKEDTVPNKLINKYNYTSKYHHKLICKFA